MGGKPKGPGAGQRFSLERRATPSLFMGQHGAPPPAKWAHEMAGQIKQQQQHSSAAGEPPPMPRPLSSPPDGERGAAAAAGVGFASRPWTAAEVWDRAMPWRT